MSALARETGLNRDNLNEAFSEGGNPTLATLLKVTLPWG
jgi:DNA-binding phage protein